VLREGLPQHWYLRVGSLVTRTHTGLVPEMVSKTGANMVAELFLFWYLAVLGIQIWIRIFLGLPDPDP